MIKRTLDIFVGMVALVVFSPVIAFLAVLVRFKLGSPIFFRQERLGLGGEPFLVSKFRTMTDERDGNGDLLPDEQRLTRLGRALRRTSLDELPELLDVLRGDMSLVGPRPLRARYRDLYSAEQFRRHEVKPGLTGWAQVNGRKAITWEEKFAYDVWYVDHRSLWLDLQILARTFGVVFAGSGAQGGAPFTGNEEESQPDGL